MKQIFQNFKIEKKIHPAVHKRTEIINFSQNKSKIALYAYQILLRYLNTLRNENFFHQNKNSKIKIT